MSRRSRKPGPSAESAPWRGLLRRYRFTHNIKQAALAADLGVTQAMVSRWESGVVEPSPQMQAVIRSLLDDGAVSVPLIDWRTHVAKQPGLAAVIDRDGRIETASAGLLRLLGLPRRRVEGRALDALFSGDIPHLYKRLSDAGFFDEALESVESVDRYCFVDDNGRSVECCVQGLHWPHRDEDGNIRWILTGAVVGEADFARIRRAMTGQVDTEPAQQS